MPRKPKTITLNASVQRAVAERQRIIREHEYVLSALNLELQGFIERVVGVDLKREHWELDLDAGVLVRQGGPGATDKV